MLADTTSRPACHASEKAYAWRKKQGADAHNKTHKKKTSKNMTDNQQANFKEPSHSFHYTTPHSARTRACFLERGAAFIPSFPQLSEDISSSSSSSSPASDEIRGGKAWAGAPAEGSTKIRPVGFSIQSELASCDLELAMANARYTKPA